MILVLPITLVDRMILALWNTPGHQMMRVLQIIPALRTTPGRRMTTVLEKTKETGAEAKGVAERTSEQELFLISRLRRIGDYGRGIHCCALPILSALGQP
jgi:hypothetical protein